MRLRLRLRLLGSHSAATLKLSQCASPPTCTRIQIQGHVQVQRSVATLTFQPDDLVLLKNTHDRTAAPILTRPLKPGRRIESHRGVVLHDDIIGRSVRDVVRAQTPRSTKGSVGAEYRLHHVTLDEYCRLSKRLVTPIYAADANLIASLLDLHPADTDDETQHRTEILEAGTGHGALTMHLSRAMRNSHATLHTIDVSPSFSAHAREIVAGFRGGIYAKNVNFHVGDVSEWVTREAACRETNPFLAHAFLDLPNAGAHVGTLARALKIDGMLIVFNPSISQITEVAMKIKNEGIQLHLEKVVELGVNGGTGGREWDVRFVRPRAEQRKEMQQKELAETEDSQHSSLFPGDADESEPAEAAAEAVKCVCRPAVGVRIVGGGFLGVWRKQRDLR